jgi:DNA-binding transcriptional regulator YhcF (GntR family)
VTDKVRDSRQAGHFWADNELLDVYGPKVGAYGVAVYMVLCRYADNKTGESFPAIRTIAAALAISRPTVTKALQTLEGAKLIRIKRRYIRGSKERDNNVYVLLNVPKVVNDVYHVVNEIDDGGKGDLPQVVNDVASKKTQLKKTNQKDSNGRAADPLFDVITEHWHTAPGQTAQLKSFVNGTNKRNALCNFAPPADAAEVAAFVEWYSRKYPGINLPVAPEKLQSHFYAFRRHPGTSKRPETRYNPITRTTEEKVGDTWYSKLSQGAR